MMTSDKEDIVNNLKLLIKSIKNAEEIEDYNIENTFDHMNIPIDGYYKRILTGWRETSFKIIFKEKLNKYNKEKV